MSALDDALDTLTDPAATWAVRLGAVSIVRREVESLGERNTRLGLLRVEAEVDRDRLRTVAMAHVNAYGYAADMQTVVATFRALVTALDGAA